MSFELSLTAVVTLLLVAARVFAWSLVAPPLATGGSPRSVKALLSVAIGLLLVPAAQLHAPPLDTWAILESLLWQVFIGTALGFLTRLLFAAIGMAGGLIDLLGAFAMSAAYSPLTTTRTTVMGKFYTLLAVTLIFATDAHLLIFRGFVRTVDAIPLNATMSLGSLGNTLAHATTDMFVGALQIAGPLLVVLWVADIGVGVLNRIAPQLNAFTMSFPIKIGLTLILVGAGLTLLPNTVEQIAHDVNQMIGAIVG